MRELFRAIPAVDLCLRALIGADASLECAPRPLLRDLVSAYWQEKRERIRAGEFDNPCQLELENQLPLLLAYVRKGLRPNLRPVLNGAGVVIHTNLGRSVLAPEAVAAISQAASGYNNLELDLETGNRGSRHKVTEDLLKRLTGAEAALVVNNNAAAVFLVLNTLCAGGEVIVARGELVEIGGSFRIPDIMLKSGAILREVGATNRTHLYDYESALNESTRAILRAHTSNYRIIGFHAAVELADLVRLAHTSNLPLIFDLGSGSLLDFTDYGLEHEPTVGAIVASGADCVCFSGDKILGGPQAGIIVGKKAIIDQLKKNPLCRALRCCKLTLAGLEATLHLYLEPDLARKQIPTPTMICKSPADVAKSARNLAARIRSELKKNDLACAISLCPDSSRVGGGAFPEQPMPTTLVCLAPAACSATALRDMLLQAEPPLIGRMEKDAFCLDPRTLQTSDFKLIGRVVVWALQRLSESGK